MSEGTIQWFATFTEFGCNPIRNQFVNPDNSVFVEEFVSFFVALATHAHPCRFYDVVQGLTSLPAHRTPRPCSPSARRPERVRAPVAVPCLSAPRLALPAHAL